MKYALPQTEAELEAIVAHARLRTAEELGIRESEEERDRRSLATLEHDLARATREIPNARWAVLRGLGLGAVLAEGAQGPIGLRSIPVAGDVNASTTKVDEEAAELHRMRLEQTRARIAGEQAAQDGRLDAAARDNARARELGEEIDRRERELAARRLETARPR